MPTRDYPTYETFRIRRLVLDSEEHETWCQHFRGAGFDVIETESEVSNASANQNANGEAAVGNVT